MPSLRDTLNTKLPNYAPVSVSPKVSVQPVSPQNANMRFILPPFNADPDSVRLFESPSPKIRVWPRPQQKAGSTATATSTVSGGSTSASNSSSSSSSSSTSLLAKTVTVTTGPLPAGTIFQSALGMSQSFQLITMTANSTCEVRIYGTQQAQIFDASRPTGSPVPPEISQNIISCVTFDTNPFVWGWQNRVGSNQNNPQTNVAYVSIFNTVPASAAPVTVTITYLPLET